MNVSRGTFLGLVAQGASLAAGSAIRQRVTPDVVKACSTTASVATLVRVHHEDESLCQGTWEIEGRTFTFLSVSQRLRALAAADRTRPVEPEPMTLFG